MVTLGPDTQSTNYSHMYDFQDLSNPERPQICLNKGSLYHFLVKHPDFTRFSEIIRRAKMDGQLNELEADFTLFIPSDNYLQHIPNEYFEKMDDGLARQILNSSTMRRKIDKYLITSSPVAYYSTLDPRMRMYVTNISGVTRINNCASIVKYGLNFSNGTIHVVDNLIAPNEDHFMN